VNRLLGWANALTALRLLLILPSVWFISRLDFAGAALVFCLAVATDLLDGPVARARQEVTPLGGVFDHSVDASFVACSLASLALLDEPLSVTPVLPVLVLVSFIQYALDSKVLAGHTLRASSLGRYNGIGYFVLLGIAVIGPVIGAPLGLTPDRLALLVPMIGWLLVVTTLVSMLDRFVAYQKARG